MFHTTGWLRALQRTYGYEPIVFTTGSPCDQIKDALLFCRVKSWITGRRLVSLPFSDHCEPLIENPEVLRQMLALVQVLEQEQRWKYIEIRSSNMELHSGGGFQQERSFCLHRLDLRPKLDSLFAGFHKTSVQQPIRRAEREGLICETGRSEMLLRKFYSLLLLTRRRHQIPPQPLTWFRNLVECVGGNTCIRIASKDHQPVAGILTLSHGKRVVYKYGASDPRLNHLGGIARLLWETIQDAKQAGAEELDFGRSDCDNIGLITFKERWSAERFHLTHWRYPINGTFIMTGDWKAHYAKWLFARLPDSVLTLTGKVLYRHLG